MKDEVRSRDAMLDSGWPMERGIVGGAPKGAYLDPTGLYHIGERYYDPDLGRWLQQDPVVDALDPQQWNRYVYVGNDPINHIDPTGTVSVRCVLLNTVGVAPPQSLLNVFTPGGFLDVALPSRARHNRPNGPSGVGPFHGWDVSLGTIASHGRDRFLLAHLERLLPTLVRLASPAAKAYSLGSAVYRCR